MNHLPLNTRPATRRIAAALTATLIAATLLGACGQDADALAAAGETAIKTAAPIAVNAPTPDSAPTSVRPPADNAAPVADAPAIPAAGGQAMLAVGQSVRIAPSSKLRFERIVSDSRCPAGAQCVWGGEVTIALTLNSADAAIAFELSQSKNRTTVQSFAFEFVSFGPCKTGDGSNAGECASIKVSPLH